MRLAVDRIRFGKFGLMMAVLWLVLVPWANGGKDPAAIIMSYFGLFMAVFLAVRLPNPAIFKDKVLALCAMVFIGWSALSLIWSVNRYATVRSLVVTVMALAVFGLAYQFNGDWGRFKVWAKGYLAIAAVTGVIGFLIYLTSEYTRLTSIFYWANPYAAFLLPAVILSTWFYVIGGGKFYFVVAIINGAAFALTDSRSAYLVLGAVLIGIMFKARLQPAAWRRVLVLAVLVVVAVVGVNFLRKSVSRQSVVAPGSRLVEAAKGESNSGRDRLYYLGSAWQIWKDYPWLGSGAGTYGSVHPNYQMRVVSASSSAHNYYAQTLAELGVVGIISLGGLVIVILVGGWRRVRNDGRWWPVWLSLLAVVVHFGLDIDHEYPTLMMLVAILSGLIYLPANKLPKQAQPRYLQVMLAGLVLIGLPTISLYQSYLARSRGNGAQDINNFAIAAEYFQTAHVGVAYDPDVLTAEGINYYSLASMGEQIDINLALAEERAKEAIELDRFDAQHVLLLARTLREKGDKTGSEREYRRAIELDPYNNPEYYSDLVSLELEQNKINEALGYVNQALDLYNDSVVEHRASNTDLPRQVATLYASRALVLVRQDKLEQAKVDLERAFKLDKTNPLAVQIRSQLMPK